MFDKAIWKDIPEGFILEHIAGTFTQTVKWWADGGMKETPEEIEKYFDLVLK